MEIGALLSLPHDWKATETKGGSPGVEPTNVPFVTSHRASLKGNSQRNDCQREILPNTRPLKPRRRGGAAQRSSISCHVNANDVIHNRWRGFLRGRRQFSRRAFCWWRGTFAANPASFLPLCTRQESQWNAWLSGGGWRNRSFFFLFDLKQAFKKKLRGTIKKGDFKPLRENLKQFEPDQAGTLY